jgi:hypothetical protein
VQRGRQTSPKVLKYPKVNLIPAKPRTDTAEQGCEAEPAAEEIEGGDVQLLEGPPVILYASCIYY